MKPSGNKPSPAEKTSVVLAPDYYWQFHCTGPDCEDNCCAAGWRIDIDRKTWERYQQTQDESFLKLVNQHMAIEPDIKRRSDKAYAYIKLQPNGGCAFQQSSGMCAIHQTQGGAALSETCAAFPRHHNHFAEQKEYGLGIACPEVARLVLLPSEPIKLNPVSPEHPLSPTDVDLTQRGFKTYVIPQTGPHHNAFRHEFRRLILNILQCRDISIGARLMVLGLLLDQINAIAESPNHKHSSEFLPTLETFKAALATPAIFEEQFERISCNLPHKLQVMTSFMIEVLGIARPRFGECILACVSGLLGTGQGTPEALLSNYQHAYIQHYRPFVQEHPHLLENYLVNDVLINLFPFAKGNFFEQYSALIFNLSIVQTALIGMAGHYRGLNNERVIQLIQSFTRATAHNDTYLKKLYQTAGINEQQGLLSLVWMLKEN